jgi:hypothetical protein
MVDTQILAPTATSKKFHSLYVCKLMSDSNVTVTVNGEETFGGELVVNNNETEGRSIIKFRKFVQIVHQYISIFGTDLELRCGSDQA